MRCCGYALPLYLVSNNNNNNNNNRRPASLAEPPGPQERIQRCTVEQCAGIAPMVQIPDAPVLQTVDQLVEVLRLFDTMVPEQVIDVPKITSQDVIPQRAALCRTAGGRARALKNSKNEEIWLGTQNPLRFPGFTVVVVTFYRQNPRRCS